MRSQPKPPPIIEFKAVAKNYGRGDAKVYALRNANFTIPVGSFTAILGPSGSGKSTILNLIGLLDRPSKGEYLLDQRNVSDITNENDRATLRRDKFGFIFQQFNLLKKETALANVMMPAVYSKLENRKEKATYILKQLGLSHRLHHRPNQLSGGEQQRVAIARALINKPRIILADEPTGNLDSKTGQSILDLLKNLNRDGQTVIVVTHDESIANLAHKIIRVKDGTTQ